MNTSHGDLSSIPETDLSLCDREPIHIPGSIQPHGFLLALREPDLTIVQASANADRLLGESAESLLERPVVELFPELDQAALVDRLRRAKIRNAFYTPLHISLEVDGEQRRLMGNAHSHDGLVILEMEAPFQETTVSKERLAIGDDTSGLAAIQQILGQLHGMDSAQAVCEAVVHEVRNLTGFDRVMVYRFAEDGHGEVIAESLASGQDSYLGLHYRASDIPQQARQLYTQNWLRLIPDIHYRPVPLVPSNNPLTGQPLNLSFAVLRSVSPVHIEYLANMGVAASMSISVVRDDQLWGLIACHHRSPRHVPSSIRNACEALGSVLSLHMATKTEAENALRRAEQKTLQNQLLNSVARDDDVSTLAQHGDQLMALTDAQGAAIRVNGRVELVGRTPSGDAVDSLVDYLQSHSGTEVFCTDRLMEDWPTSKHFQDSAAGLLAVALNPVRGDYLLFFRPEFIHTVTWAGSPHKSVHIDPTGRPRMDPDFSFDSWRETVHQRSRPWNPEQIQAAKELRNALVTYVIQHAEELARYNRSLNARNIELDAFAYVTSHDLKEPLRGIHSYAEELIEHCHDQLDPRSQEQLLSLTRLSERMDHLLDSLLHFARVNRTELSRESMDLNSILDEALDMVSARRTETGSQIQIPRPMPIISGDSLQVREIFTNLISNALKYNDKSNPWVEIGYLEEDPIMDLSPVKPPVFYVRDNGIGIKERYFDRIFQMFKRLHGPQRYGGGTGAGLTIARKIIERHGGKLWLHSTPGEGTVFYFTLLPLDNEL